MRKKYPQLGSEHEIKRELYELGIDVFAPETRYEEATAQAFGEFSHFVLVEEKDACLEILEDDMLHGNGSVGELQGGSDEYSIYRASFPVEDACEGACDGGGSKMSSNAALRLLERYNRRSGRSGKSSLTIERMKRYMRGMCDRRGRERGAGGCAGLGNVMLIVQFGGPTEGQVRHIDNMVPNVQICTYMSRRCPSTVVYAMEDGDGPPVADGASLVGFWERRGKNVPKLVRDVLARHGDVELKSKWYAKHFAWETLNLQLQCFGKLYQPVAYQLGLEVEPGTTLLAGGNEIHAGPPTTESRMFAFAIGIPEDDSKDGNERDDGPPYGYGVNDGEVQYSPVLFHIDFCCVLFSIIDFECKSIVNKDSVQEAKRFLVSVLLELIEDYPMTEYLLQIDEGRVGVRSWLENILALLESRQSTDALIKEAVQSDTIFFSPDVTKRRSKKKKSRPKSKRSY